MEDPRSQRQPRDPLQEPPVHLPRLLRRLRALDTSVIVLLGWPGTGRRRLLAGLRDLLGEKALSLVGGGDLEIQLRRARDRGARWFVAEGGDTLGWVESADRLMVGERLVVSAHDFEPLAALPDGGAAAAIGHRELLLLPEESAALARSRGADPAVAEAWSRWSDGWLVPLEIGLDSGTSWTTAASPLDVPGMRDFLLYRVLHRLAPVHRQVLGTVAKRLSERPQMSEEELRRSLQTSDEVWRQLVEHLGWLLRDGATLRPPRPLTEILLGSPGGGGQRAAVAAGTAAPKTEPTVGFRLRLLGSPEVFRVDAAGGSHRLRWPFRRVLELLAFLASAEGRASARERIADAIWQRGEAGEWRRNLHPTVSHLRSVLRDPSRSRRLVLGLRQGVYSLTSDLYWQIDVARFEELSGDLADHSLGALEEAWALYRGPFLEGFESPWISERRRRLEKSYRRLLMTLGERYSQAGRLIDAEDAYRTLLVADTVSEEVHLEIMRLSARRGRPDLVRRQYQRLCRLLMEELGVQPMDVTAREYQRLLGWNR